MARTKKKGRGGKKSKVNFSSLLFSSLLISFVVKFGYGVWRDSELVLDAFSHAETVVRMLYNIFCVPVTYFLSPVALFCGCSFLV
jgi:hypothetical protein